MSRQTELQGFLSIKIPPKMRGFIPWKTWRRQWISIRCSQTGAIDLILGKNSQNALRISQGDIIVRTQSRSHIYAFGIYPREGVTANFCLAGTSESDTQKWISTLRRLLRPPLLPVEEEEFSVSVIDNTFTRSSGFPGLYGILRIINSGIIITDPCTSKIKTHWLWGQLSHSYLASPLKKEDAGRICTIITSREFPTGTGKIRIFCSEAPALVRNLTMGKISRFVKFHSPDRSWSYLHHALSPDNRSKEFDISGVYLVKPKRRTSLADSIKDGRRLSKSESNLFSVLDQDTSSECSDSGFIQDFYNSLLSSRFSDDDDNKLSPDSDGFSFIRKISPSAIRDCSPKTNIFSIPEAKPIDSNHVYQELNEEADDGSIEIQRGLWSRSPRRQSRASVASGVYEEIDEFSSCFARALNTAEENARDSPPPLPPRRGSFKKRLKSNAYQNVCTLELPELQNKYKSRSAGNTPLPSPPSLSRTASSAEFFAAPWQKEEESHYLPMNSRARRFSQNSSETNHFPEEQHYVDMSSFTRGDAPFRNKKL